MKKDIYIIENIPAGCRDSLVAHGVMEHGIIVHCKQECGKEGCPLLKGVKVTR